LETGSIAIAPSNTNIVYVGTGEASTPFFDSFPGVGVLKSTNAGQTWTLLGKDDSHGNPLFDQRSIAKIVVDPTNASIVYVAVATFATGAAAGNAGIWKSTDGGLTWVDTTTSPTANIAPGDSFVDLAMDPTNDQVLYAAAANPAGNPGNSVYKTTDGGVHWAVAGNFPVGGNQGRITLSVAPTNNQIVYAAVGNTTNSMLLNVEQSTDAGTTWTALPGIPNFAGTQAYYDLTIAADPTDATGESFYAGGQAGANSVIHVVVTPSPLATTVTDISGGTNPPHADHHAIAFDATNHFIDGDDGGVWRLNTISPVVWSNLNGNLQITTFVGIATDSKTANIAYGGSQDNGTERFNDNLVWNRLLGGDGGFVAVDFNTPTTIYQASPRGDLGAGIVLQRSTNSGGTWTDITPGGSTGGLFYIPYVMDPVNSTRLLYGDVQVFETTNSTASPPTWTAIGTSGVNGFNSGGSAIATIAIAPSATNTIYVAIGTSNNRPSGGTILKTTNDGGAWTTVSIPGVTNGIEQLVVDPFNSQIVYAVRNVFGGGEVYRSADGGTTWANITANLPLQPAYSMAIDPRTSPPTLYLGTADNGVMASFDEGGSWVRLGSNLPNAQARYLELQLHNNLDILSVGTYGRGMFQLQNNGTLVVTAITPAPQSLVEGREFDHLETATIIDTAPGPHPLSNYAATIDWGDGTPDTAGEIIEDAAGVFHVSGAHTYAEEGTFIVTTTVSSTTGSVSGASTAPFTVIDAPLTAQAAPIAAVEGQPLGVTTILATFTDADSFGTTTDYSATINWGDGTPTVAALISEPAGPGLPFNVSQAAILGHTYAEEGNYVTTVVISDSGGSKTIVNGEVHVADAPLTSTGLPTPPIIPEGTQFSGAVATFSDLDPAGTIADYTATITWGDGTTTLGTIAPGTPGLFNVMGTHTFEEGTYTVSVVIADAGGATTTAVSTFKIPDAPLLVAPIPALTETEAQSFTAPVGAFTDANDFATLSDFSASINWGDGSPVTAGVISQQAVGTFIVTGTHTYATNSTGSPPFPVTFRIRDVGGQLLFGAAGALVTVLDAWLSSSAGTTIKGTEGIPTGTVLIGTFTDLNPAAKASDFKAILPPGGWGDGKPLAPVALTVMQISATAGNTVFEVTGSHTYIEPGQFPITVIVSNKGGAAAVISSTALIADAKLAFPPQFPIKTTEAAIYPLPVFAPPVFSGAVAFFTDANPLATASGFRATIDWGDGTAPTSGTVVRGPAHTFQVDGSHTYADAGVNGGTGSFKIHVYITDDDGSKLTVPNTALVADNPIKLTGSLNPTSDSGKNNADAITNVIEPNFQGTSEPFSTVTLFETPIAGGAAVKIGQVEAHSDGSWSVNSSKLATGTYKITGSAIDQFGKTATAAPVTMVPTLVVDTVAPTITNLSFNRLDGTLTVTFKDNLSGMDLASLANSAFYHISATPLSTKVQPPKLILPTKILYTPGALPSDPVVVKVVFNDGHSMRGGKYEVVIDSGTGDHGIQDVAGNALDGNFYGKFPTGDGLPGGDFVAEVETFHHLVLPLVPIKSGYVPPPAGIDPPAGSSTAKKPVTHHAAAGVSHTSAAPKAPTAVHDAAVHGVSSDGSHKSRRAH
jgi:hypothetical protein